MPIYEPGLDQLVAANVAAGRLSFTTDLAGAVAEAEARSEEHTSELQSIMRTSYAVLCFKKNKQIKPHKPSQSRKTTSQHIQTNKPIRHTLTHTYNTPTCISNTIRQQLS